MDNKHGYSGDRQTSTASVTRVKLVDESGPKSTHRKRVGESYEACITREAEGAVAELSPQLVSRQFGREYEERAARESCLLIVDRDHFHGEMLTLPRPMRLTRKLELHIALACTYIQLCNPPS